MSEELFDVVFFGILQAGKDKDTVMQNMAKIFKTDAAKLAPYFAGGRKVVKGKVNAGMAEKYQSALENAGLVIKIEPCTAAAPTPASKKQPAETGADADGISIAPVGANVLENPVEVAAQKIDDISDITMAETGVDVLEHSTKVAAQQIDDISDITMAEVGTDVLEHSVKVTPQKIDDFSDMSMAEAGADLVENPKPKEKVPEADISELSLDEEKT